MSALRAASLRWMLAAWLVVLALPALAAPRAFLDRDTVRLGETVTLNVETDARGGSEPDFSVLDQHFRRIGTSSNTTLRWVDGKQSATTLWAVALEPLAEGSFGIPSFAVGNERTQPLRLTVLPMPQGGSAAAGDDVYLEVEADPASPYVQQQARYAIRLYFAVPLLEGQLEDPQAEGARVVKIGQDVQYRTTLHGRSYSVIERRYAVIAETSGTLQIPGPRFRGRVLLTGGYGSLGSNSLRTARADDLTLEVRPRPPAAATPWLPAQSLVLEDESGAPPAQLKVGEPLTLALHVRAQGVSAEQLPELALPAIEGAQVYPDQELSRTGDDGQWLQSSRQRKFAIVPLRPGTLEIPATEVAWWNVATDRAEVATLPARRVTVLPAPGSAAIPPPDDAVEDAPATSHPEAPAALDWNQPWAWAALAFALLWLGTLGLLLARRRRAAAVTPTAVAHAAPAPEWKPALERGDLAGVAHALVALGRARDATCRNLDDLATRLADKEQRLLLARLERALYCGAADGTLLADLRAGFARGPRWGGATSRTADTDALPPLYPPRD